MTDLTTTKTKTTGTCAACRLPDVAVKLPDPLQYPEAVPEPVCADCPPLHPLELGAATLTNPTPAARAAAECVFRTVLAPDQPCRCSGGSRAADGTATPCSHGQACEECGTGRMLHTDRYAIGMISAPDSWMDTYTCSDCPEWYTTETRLLDLPWGVAQSNDRGEFTGYDLYDGIRHGQFNTDPEGVE
jgi:hypothetical protein